MSETVPVHLVEYENPSEIETDDDYTVTNHDELTKKDVVVAMEPETAEENNLDVIGPGDTLWKDEYEDAEVGERLDVLA